MSIKKGGQPLPAMIVRRIGALRGLSRIPDDHYYALLGGYGVESCRELSPGQAAEVIEVLQRLVGPAKRRAPERHEDGSNNRKWEDLGCRRGMATPRQLGLIEVLWKDVSYQKNSADRASALLTFLRKRFERSQMEHIEQELVGPIVRTLQAMQQQQSRRREQRNQESRG